MIRNNPSLRTATITSFPASSEGKTFLIRVKAFTSEDSALSPALSIKLAGPPGKPTSAPVLVQEETDTTKITVQLGEVTDTGNDAILTYNLQIDDGNGGDFRSVAGDSIRSLQRTHTITSGISRGVSYRFRYRAGNSVGWSAFSDNLVAQAATYPKAPPALTLASSQADSITINLHESSDNQGAAITLYELWMNSGTDGSALTMIQSWTSLPLSFEATATANSLVAGGIYTFQVRAKNTIGYSDFSSGARFAAASLPGPLAAPTKVSALSNATHITVSWAEAAATEVGITNYRLYVSRNGGDYTLAYDGNRNILKRTFTLTGGLVAGALYSFQVSVMNMNGEGPLSGELEVHACDSPSIPEPPSRITSTKTSVSLSWSPPAADGGCPLSGYRLLTDSGTGGSVDTDLDTALHTNPQIQSYVATFDSSKTGSWIRFRLAAINAEASATSKTIQFVLAIPPEKPTNPPSEVASGTSDVQLSVIASELTSENGGAPIIGYEFQVDDGRLGEFTTVQGGAGSRTLSTKAVITQGISRGLAYRVRYRGINQVGEGAWSDSVTIIASTVPARPDAPQIGSADNTQITLLLTPNSDSGGEAILRYELFYSDSGVSLTTFSQDTSYDGSSMTYSFSSSITAGHTYGFKFRAVNGRGDSEFSEIVYAAAGRLPSTPAAPTLDLSQSNRTHLTIVWASGTSLDIPVLGYRLSADDRGNGEFSTIWNGYGQPNVQKFTYGPLETGETYGFYVQVLNYNGASAASPILSVAACEGPSGFTSLERVSSSPTSLTIAWRPPLDDGGCSVLRYEQYSDDGAGGSLAVENAALSSSTLEVTLDRSSDSGKAFKLQVIAVNANGQVKSNIINVLAAGVPADPTNPPTSSASTDGSQIGVLYDEVTNTGSSPITSYELQKDDGKGGSFLTIYGGDQHPTLSRTFLVKTNITTGVAYRFRYRARNLIGWSGWSPISSLSASTVPSPPGISYVSSSDTQIVLAFSQSSDNGGSIITNYQLDLDEVLVTDYDFSTDGFSYTADKTTLSLTTGTVYAFRYRAINSVGASQWSVPLSVALAGKPSAPAAPFRSPTGNSESSIGVSWTALTGETLPVIAYVLYVDDGSSSDYTELYRGSSTQFEMVRTSPSASYTFYVKAINFVGEGPLSSGTTLKS